MARKVKAAAVPIYVPQSREQVVNAINEIGFRQRECLRLAAQMNDKIAAIKLSYEASAKLNGDVITDLKQGIQIWCEANKVALTNNGRTKTARFASGEVRWRMTPPKVTLKGVADILKRLKSNALTRFIRVSEEVDKAALLKEPDVAKGIAGVTISQGEEFVIVPLETQLEEIA